MNSGNNFKNHGSSRRSFVRSIGLTSLFMTVPGAFAEALVQTPKQTEGPFYPDKLPLDTDNDLLRINDAITPAAGAVTYLSGRVLDHKGDPIRNAEVEIWQTDNNGIYLHSESKKRGDWDGNFQGFGRFLTGSTGDYFFRTIKPVTYPGRTPHIHFAVNHKGKRILTTQCYIKGHPQNARDNLLNRIKDRKQRESVQVDFAPIPNADADELAARFDIVLGFTPKG